MKAVGGVLEPGKSAAAHQEPAQPARTRFRVSRMGAKSSSLNQAHSWQGFPKKKV